MGTCWRTVLCGAESGGDDWLDSEFFAGDTSILKQIQKGRDIWEMFEKANLDLEIFDLEKLKKLKNGV